MVTPDTTVDQVVFAWDRGRDYIPVAGSSRTVGRSLLSYVRADGGPDVSLALVELDPTRTALIRRWSGVGDSDGRDGGAHALVGTPEVLTPEMALQLADWSGWQDPKNLAGLAEKFSHNQRWDWGELEPIPVADLWNHCTTERRDHLAAAAIQRQPDVDRLSAALGGQKPSVEMHGLTPHGGLLVVRDDPTLEDSVALLWGLRNQGVLPDTFATYQDRLPNDSGPPPALVIMSEAPSPFPYPHNRTVVQLPRSASPPPAQGGGYVGPRLGRSVDLLRSGSAPTDFPHRRRR